MGIRSTFVIVLCVCFSRVSLAQNSYEFVQHPEQPNYYYVDTFKTDFGPGGELIRPERSFLKNLFNPWKKSNGNCMQCCPNNSGYKGGAAGDGDSGNGYEEEEQYGDPFTPPFNPEDLPPEHHGHLYLPLPHPHRIMSHLHHIVNLPFRRGYGGKVGPPGYYSSKGAAPAVEKPYEPPPKEEPAKPYQEPAPDDQAPEEPAPAEPEPEEESEDKPAEEPAEEPEYTEKPDYADEDKYDQKEEEEAYKEDDEDKTYDKEDESMSAPNAAPVTPQVIQPIVPIIAPPVYFYPQQYYPPPPAMPPIPYGQQYVYPAQQSLSYPAAPVPYSAPSSYPAAPVQYSAPPQASVSYSLSAPQTSLQYNLVPTVGQSYSASSSQEQPQPQAVPTYTPPTREQSYSPPAPSVQVGPTKFQPQPQFAPAYTAPPSESSYLPPVPSYSQVDPSQLQPQSQWQLVPTYTAPPPTPLSYCPLKPTSQSSFSNPSDCSYLRKIYSTSLTYLQSPPPPSCYEHDQLMRSCPELFRDYQLRLQAVPVSRAYY